MLMHDVQLVNDIEQVLQGDVQDIQTELLERNPIGQGDIH